jgi:hypothetical protein
MTLFSAPNDGVGVRKHSRIVRVSEKSWEKMDILYYGWKKSIILLEGPQALCIFSFDKSSMRA